MKEKDSSDWTWCPGVKEKVRTARDTEEQLSLTSDVMSVEKVSKK